MSVITITGILFTTIAVLGIVVRIYTLRKKKTEDRSSLTE